MPWWQSIRAPDPTATQIDEMQERHKTRVAAKAALVLPAPAKLSFEQASGICITYFTTMHALKQRAQLQAGETLLVLGAAGGVGTTAVELGKQMGATVIAAASSNEKLELTRKLGADHTINYATEDLRERLKTITDMGSTIQPSGIPTTCYTIRWVVRWPNPRCAAWRGGDVTS